MARFLSPEWFAEIARHSPPRPAAGIAEPAEPTEPADLVLEQVVRDTPDGDLRYRVVVAGGSAAIEFPVGAAEDPTTTNGVVRAPDLTIACDWATAGAMARGELSAHAALMAGRLQVSGNLARLTGRSAQLIGLDPVPEQVRRQTTY